MCGGPLPPRLTLQASPPGPVGASPLPLPSPSGARPAPPCTPAAPRSRPAPLHLHPPRPGRSAPRAAAPRGARAVLIGPPANPPACFRAQSRPGRPPACCRGGAGLCFPRPARRGRPAAPPAPPAPTTPPPLWRPVGARGFARPAPYPVARHPARRPARACRHPRLNAGLRAASGGGQPPPQLRPGRAARHGPRCAQASARAARAALPPSAAAGPRAAAGALAFGAPAQGSHRSLRARASCPGFPPLCPGPGGRGLSPTPARAPRAPPHPVRPLPRSYLTLAPVFTVEA
jgi:hypothetical protein